MLRKEIGRVFAYCITYNVCESDGGLVTMVSGACSNKLYLGNLQQALDEQVIQDLKVIECGHTHLGLRIDLLNE
jgi:hypothetical protein